MLGLALEHDVDHAGDGVRAVLRRCAVAQHLDALDRGRGDRVQVHAHRAAAERAVHVDERARVAPLSVDQHEDLIGAEPAQARRIDLIRAIGDGLVGRVERRGERGEHLVDFRQARLGHFLRRDHVDRHRRLGGGAGGARAHDDDFVERERRRHEREVGGDGLARRHRDAPLRDVIADEPRADGVRARRHAQGVPALRVGQDAARGSGDHDARARQGRSPLGGDDGAADRAVLLSGDARVPEQGRRPDQANEFQCHRQLLDDEAVGR